MPKNQPETFPFDFIVLWIRPMKSKMKKCLFCQEQAEYELHNYVHALEFLDQGMDVAWMKAIKKQVDGNYEPAYIQPVCLDCCIHFASIQLGKKRPIQELLTLASITKKQKGIELSQVLVVTVRSFNDEGDNWITSAPNAPIDVVVEHVRNIDRVI